MVESLLPGSVRRLLWDVPGQEIDPQKHPAYIIERVLEFGTPEAIRWMLKQYPGETIREVLSRSRSLSRRSAHFWKFHFDIEHDEAACSSRSSLPRPSGTWNR